VRVHHSRTAGRARLSRLGCGLTTAGMSDSLVVADESDHQIAGYRVVQRLGAGGMGEVFLVEHPRLPRRDALKLLDGGVSRNEEFRSRFQREAEMLAPLSHANITTLYDRGEWGGRLWLTMEYIAGQDGAQLIRQRGLLSLALATEIVAGAGAALDYAYTDYRITHRDVKPANILVAFGAADQLKTVKLADFGIAKAAGETTSLTSTGVTVGTLSYLSPEAIEDRVLDNRADIYSLGCTAFQLLTGELPYTATSIAALMSAHLSSPVPAITARAPRLPAYLDEVFTRVLAKNPNDRYQTCAQFVAALRERAESATRATKVASHTESRQHTTRTGEQRQQAASQPTLAASPKPAPQPQTVSPTPRRARRISRRTAIITATVLALIVVVLVPVVGLGHRGATAAVHDNNPIASPGTEPTAYLQTVLPFDDVRWPEGVAVDGAGSVYVTDSVDHRVVELAARSDSQTVLPFTGLKTPEGVAVDAAGNVYIAEPGGRAVTGRVVKLAAGSDSQTVLPFTGLTTSWSVAVDAAGNVYVTDGDNNRVMKLAAGSDSQTVLPFVGLKVPGGVAVDAAGNVYVTDGDNNRVVKLAAGSDSQTVLPFVGLKVPSRVAVDAAGNVYVTEYGHLDGPVYGRVVKLAAGSNSQTVLPFTDLQNPTDVAVDAAGNVYVTDHNNRVLKLAAE
jgi:serine/threonine protein kinase, bacterial